MIETQSTNDNRAFKYMEMTLAKAYESLHPTNKVGATIFSPETGKSISKCNHWPNSIKDKIGCEEKIGNSSGTIHAETACITASNFATEESSICITDPFCPNCAKNIAEAGIKVIYIDQAGFEKDFFKRRSGHFDTMSMQICERAGISVYALDMEERKVISILEIPHNYEPIEDSPVEYTKLETATEKYFSSVIQEAFEKHKKRKFSIAIVKDTKGKYFALTARAHVVIGYTMQDPEEALDLLSPVGKYSFIQEPVNRLMMHLARKNLTLIDDYFFCSQVPTSREQVNIVGAEIKRITIGDLQKSRDPSGFKALEQLSKAKIIDYS